MSRYVVGTVNGNGMVNHDRMMDDHHGLWVPDRTSPHAGAGRTTTYRNDCESAYERACQQYFFKHESVS